MINMNIALDKYYAGNITLSELKQVAGNNGYELAKFHGQIVPVKI
jgi:hypothetical protein